MINAANAANPKDTESAAPATVTLRLLAVAAFLRFVLTAWRASIRAERQGTPRTSVSVVMSVTSFSFSIRRYATERKENHVN